MRVAIVSDYYYPQLGGITEHVHGQATELTRRGHDVVVVTPRLLHSPRTVDGADLPARSFEVIQAGVAMPFYANGSETLLSGGARLGSRLDRIFRDTTFDVVHVHNPWGTTLPLTSVRRSRAPITVGTLHSVVPPGYVPLRLLRGAAARILARLDATIAVSPAIVDSLGPSFPGLAPTVIPNGIDTDFFSPAAAPLDRNGKKTIVFVGRFDPRNGVKTMIHAFVQLRAERDGVRLVVVGDGPLRPLVERLVPDTIRDDVVFTGRVNRLRPRVLAAADILCTPCTLASFGMVLLEGMSAALPVVASRLPGFAYVMRDGIDGTMVDRPGDDRGFADALHRMLDDPARAATMGAAGRERAISTFSWPVVVDRLEALYESILAHGTARFPLELAA